MRNRLLTHSIRQMFLGIAGFVAVIALLECDGLASWADHLEIGPLRTVAVPVTETMQRALRPSGLGTVRSRTLESLARIGWSDDAAVVAEARAPHIAETPMPGCVVSAGAPNAAAGSNPVARPAGVGASAPLASDVPRTASLAPLSSVEPGKPRVVALAGDSMMAVGLSAQLMRDVADHKNLRIVKAFKSGTGLARPEVFNWMDEYPAMLGAEKPDVVIVAIGANDGQGFVVDHKVLAFGSDEWRKVYQERLASFLAMVEASGARVVWVGLPPMRVASFNEKIATINRIAYTVVSQNPQAAWFSPVSFVGDDAGGFREFATLSNGKMMRLRATDGIHLSDEGAGLMTAVLTRWLDPPPPQPQIATAETTPSSIPEPVPAIQSRISRRQHRHRNARS
jgi:hypothetical protein